MLATELAILKAARTGMRTVFAGPPPQARSYVEKNALGMMALRPHDVDSPTLAFHRGPFSHVHVGRENVEQAAVVNEEPRAARRRYRDAYYLGVPGTPLVHLRLKEPVRVVHTYPVAREQRVRELLVPSDRPNELCALLRQ